jgi:membrane-associated phospholipid phosphatase
MNCKFILFAAAASVSLTSNQSAAQTSPLQTQSLQDFSRVLSPGLASRALTPEKVKQLQDEAKKDCFTPDSFQRAVPALAPDQTRPLPCSPKNPFDRFVMWNQIALDTTAIDHAPPPPGDKANPALHHLGPHRSSRAMAIVHIAMYDAINVATRFNANNPAKPIYTFETYSTNLPLLKRPVSLDLVITYAAGEVLKSLYKEQAVVIADFMAQDEANILGGKNGNGPLFQEARNLGKAAAKAILDNRNGDGSDHKEPEVGQEGFPLVETPGQWRPDPVSNIIAALGGKWGSVRPFVIKNVPTFRPPPPPSPQDAQYEKDFNEVKRLGSNDSSRSPTERTNEQTEIGTFWAYDGTAFLCAPPRLYNQIVRQLVQQQTQQMREKGEDPKLLNYARLFALANVAMADAAIAAWDAKYHFRYWRPVVGIRAAGTDGNPNTEPNVYWRALGAPASNSIRGPNFTPPFPAYPSGHATFGGALFDVLRNFWPEATEFDFMSDEYNGINKPAGSDQPRKPITRHFANLRAAEDENARSRIYLGVHWQFDADAGIAQGNQVGSFVAGSSLRCLTTDGRPIDCKPNTGADVFERFLLSTEKRVLSTPALRNGQ